MSVIYPPFEQYQMEHPDDVYGAPGQMAYPPMDPFFYGMPQNPPMADPFVGYGAPQYPPQGYQDPFASPEAMQQTQLYHFGAFAASIPPQNMTPPPAAPVYPQMPPQAPPMYAPAPPAYGMPMYPPQAPFAAAPPPPRQAPPRAPRAPQAPRTQQPQQNPQMQSAALRPRTTPQNQQNPGEQQNLQTPKEKPAYPPPSNHVPIKEGEVRKSKASYRKGSIVAICFFALLCLVSLGMLGYLLIPRLVAKSEYIALSPSAMSDHDDSFSFSDIGSLITAPDQEENAQMLTGELLAYYEQINPDFIGWLDVPGTQIHYPIVRTTNNDYYLRHTFKKSYSDYGSIFADYRCADDLSDANTVIYGHNMRNGTMFHDLVNMLDEDYLQEHQTFTITTSDARVMTYEIFSVHEVHVATDYRTITLDDYERVPYFETLQGYSDVDIPEVEFDEQSRIVTFSTCPNDSDDRYRIAVHAILVSIEPLEE